MIYRFIKLKDEPFLKRPFVGGNVHLHHRLMSLGLTQTQTLLIESSLVAITSMLAYYFGGFSTPLVTIVVVFSVLLIIFTIISLIVKRKNKKGSNGPDKNPPVSGPINSDLTPEEKYAY
jgi:hypothetical protein